MIYTTYAIWRRDKFYAQQHIDPQIGSWADTVKHGITVNENGDVVDSIGEPLVVWARKAIEEQKHEKPGT